MAGEAGSGSGIGAALTKKIGPLPAWGWGVAIGGGVLLFRIVRGGSAFPSSPATSQAAQPVVSSVIPGSESSALGQLTASDLNALRDALTNPQEVQQEAAQTSALAALQTSVNKLLTPAPSTSAPPAVKVDFAGTKTPFGTVYPTYVHTYTDAVAWIKRALANGAKPKTSTNISQTPVK